MIGWIYRIVLGLAWPWFLLDSLRRAGRVPPAYRVWWAQWGRLPPQLPTDAIWLHAVSLGEVRAAGTLISMLQQRWPEQPLLISTTTETGARAARALGVPHFYAPYDYAWVQKAVLRRLKPRVIVLLETELWPNWIRAAADRRVPVVLVNARLSDRSFVRYQRWGGQLLRDTLARITVICAQSGIDQTRFIALAPAHRAASIHDCGNMKYDLPLPTVRPWLGGAARPTWLAASTHAGEEAAVLAAHRTVLNQEPDALLVLAPRHPERAAEVEALISGAGLIGQRGTDTTVVAPKTQVFLLAQTGVLMRFFASIPVVFMGGSLVSTGGHNPIEPAVFGRAVISGPQVKNFRAIYQHLSAQKAMRTVHGSAELGVAVMACWQDPGAWAEVGARAQGVVVANRGATERILAVLADVLSTGDQTMSPAMVQGNNHPPVSGRPSSGR